MDYAIVSMASDEEGEFLFVGEKNGSVKIFNIGVGEEPDTLKQTIDIGTDLHSLSFESKYFSVISLATEKGLVIRDIKRNSNVFVFSHLKTDLYTEEDTANRKPKNSCISLAWESTSK